MGTFDSFNKSFLVLIDVADELPVHYRGGVGKSDLSELVGGYVYQSSPPNPPNPPSPTGGKGG